MAKYDDLKELLKIFNDSNLTSLEYEKDGLRVRFDRSSNNTCSLPNNPIKEEIKEEIADNKKYILSPIVGTISLKSLETKENFGNVGTKVKSGDKVCVIEAMKVMNEIKSQYNGVIEEILVKDGQIVEYGQKLFVIGD